MGQVVHTLHEGEPVLGLTSLAGELCVLRRKERDQVEVYDTISYRLQRRITVPNARGLTGITACEHCSCVYISDYIVQCIHRLSAPGVATWWPVNHKPHGISVNASHNLLVTCHHFRKIKEFNSHGKFLRELTLPDDVITPLHAIQTHSGQFIVCHGGRNDAVHRVCKISEDGRQVVQSHDGQQGSATDQYNGPVRLAVDSNEFVFVVDVYNRQVKLLSPTLGYIREVVCSGDLQWWPRKLYLDIRRRRLYVADSERHSSRACRGVLCLACSRHHALQTVRFLCCQY